MHPETDQGDDCDFKPYVNGDDAPTGPCQRCGLPADHIVHSFKTPPAK